jgi:basic membrane lipoprotein Med (substrate-binding protein (PBP1-ABC) superfamily)
VKVTYLSVSGAQTAQHAATYLSGLLQQQCDLLIAVDDGPVAAVAAGAANYPQQQFTVVRGVAGANVSVIDGTEEAAYRLLMSRYGEPTDK